MKKTPLTDVEIFYIQNNPDNLSAAELAKKFDKHLNAIYKHWVKKFTAPPTTPDPKPEPVAVVEPPKPPVGKGPNAKLAFGHVRKKGQSLATVMTPAASEIGDEASKFNRRKVGDIPALKHAIHKPYGDDHGE